jgi:hypothetical protein
LLASFANVNYCDKPIRLACLYPWEPSEIPASITIRSGKEPTIPPPHRTMLFIDNVNLVPVQDVENIAKEISRIESETREERIAKLRAKMFTFAGTLPNYDKPPERDPFD